MKHYYVKSNLILLLMSLMCGFSLQAQQVNRTLTNLQPGTLGKIIGNDSASLESLTISSGVLSLEDLQVIPQLGHLRELNLQGTRLADDMDATIPGGIFARHSTLVTVSLPANTRQLASGAFSSMPLLTTVVLPDVVTNIEMSCFNGCKRLTAFNFPPSLKVVGWSAFQGCEKLKRVHLGLALQELRGYAFDGCNAIEEVIIDGSLANLGENAFSHCTSLKRLELNGSVKEIRKFAFKEDSALNEIRVNALKPPTVGASAFYHVNAKCHVIVPLKSVSKYKKAYGWKSLALQGSHLTYDIENVAGELRHKLVACNLVDTLNLTGYMNATDLEYIKKMLVGMSHLNMKAASMQAGGTFNGKEWKVADRMPFQALSSTNVKNVILPDALTDVAERCFENCKNLQHVEIGLHTKKILAGAFLDCIALEAIIIPDEVESIELSAFSGCKALNQVHLGAALRKIWNFAFWDCASLAQITVNAENPNFDAVDHVLFNKQHSELLLYPAARSGANYQVPQSVTAIGREAFCANRELNEVTLQEGLKSIGIGAFAGCTALSTVNFPASLELLADEAFRGTALQSVELGGELETIGAHAFDSCFVMKRVVLNASINEIEEFAFAGCEALQEVVAKSVVPADAANAFSNEDGTSSINFDNCTLRVPASVIEAYRAADGWKLFKNISGLPQETVQAITMTTAAGEGEYIMLSVEGEGNIEIEGAELKFGGMAVVKNADIVIKGNVTSLDCSDSQLTALDVSKATGLTSIWCSNNMLDTLNVKPLEELKILYCMNNKIKNLDVTSNLKLEELDCSENLITAINVTSNVSLNRLLLYHNALNSIDVSKNPLLVGLDVSENRLSALDVKHNLRLETIYCNGNAIVGNSMVSFIESLPNRVERAEKCHLFVIDTKNSAEQNIIFKPQVQLALQKNWQVLDYSAGDNDGAGIDYAGREEPTGFNVIEQGDKPCFSLCNGVLVVKNIQPMSRVLVATLDGATLATQLAHEGVVVIDNIQAPVVLVTVDGHGYKLMRR